MEQIQKHTHRYYHKEVPRYGEKHHAPKNSASATSQVEEGEISAEIDEAVRAAEREQTLQVIRRAGAAICRSEIFSQASSEGETRTDLYDALNSYSED